MEEGDTGRRRVREEDEPTTRRVKQGGMRGGNPSIRIKPNGPREPGKKTRENPT